MPSLLATVRHRFTVRGETPARAATVSAAMINTVPSAFAAPASTHMTRRNVAAATLPPPTSHSASGRS